MSVLQIHHLAKNFADFSLLRDVSLNLEEGERVGLVGINGCGKTTLMRIIAGLEPFDSGQIRIPEKQKVGLLRQRPDPDHDIQVILESGYDPELAAGLNKIGLEADPFANPAALSGGERTRLALARILSSHLDLLLLDEPTNNMDFPGVQATISMLADYPASMIIVSHDRYFLDRMVTRILELDNGLIHEYPGNYSDYRQLKQQLFTQKMNRYAEDRKEQKRIEQSIRQTRQWAEKAHRKSTDNDKSGQKMGLKEYKRVKARKMDQKVKNDLKRLEKKKQQQESKPKAEANVLFQFNQAKRQGRRILEAKDLGKGYNGRQLFAGSYFYIQRGEKVAVFGPNGCGKSTLVKLMRQEELPDRGELWLTGSATPYYLNQQLDDLPAGIKLKDYLQERVGILDGQKRAVLDQMGFAQEQLALDLASFSLGERMKIKLLEPILTSKDFLILDEPTNYLDLHARETLEKALANYVGTLMIISHDIYLLQEVCDKTLFFEQGQIRRYEDSFAEFLEKYYNSEVES